MPFIIGEKMLPELFILPASSFILFRSILPNSSFFEYPLIDATHTFLYAAMDGFEADILHSQTSGGE